MCVYNKIIAGPIMCQASHPSCQPESHRGEKMQCTAVDLIMSDLKKLQHSIRAMCDEIISNRRTIEDLTIANRMLEMQLAVRAEQPRNKRKI